MCKSWLHNWLRGYLEGKPGQNYGSVKDAYSNSRANQQIETFLGRNIMKNPISATSDTNTRANPRKQILNRLLLILDSENLVPPRVPEALQFTGVGGLNVVRDCLHQRDHPNSKPRNPSRHLSKQWPRIFIVAFCPWKARITVGLVSYIV